MRKVAIGAALAALSLAAMQQASAEGFYAGAGLNSTTTKIDGGFKDDDMGFKLFGGYAVNQYFAVEVSYIDAGTAKESVEDLTLKVESDAITASVLGSLPINETFSVYARLGMASWDSKAKLYFDGDLEESAKDDGTDLLYGVGGAVNLGGNFQLRLEWESVDVDDADLDSIGVSGVFKFGSLN